MALVSARVTVGTTPTELTTHNFSQSILVQATTTTIYVGGPHVSAANGFPIPAGGSLSLDLTGERLYGVMASGFGLAYVLRNESP